MDLSTGAVMGDPGYGAVTGVLMESLIMEP